MWVDSAVSWWTGACTASASAKYDMKSGIARSAEANRRRDVGAVRLPIHLLHSLQGGLLPRSGAVVGFSFLVIIRIQERRR